MGAITDIWYSERGIFSVVLILVTTAAMFTGHITSDAWLTQLQWISAFYIGGKTVTGAVGAWQGKSAAVQARRATNEPDPKPDEKQ